MNGRVVKRGEGGQYWTVYAINENFELSGIYQNAEIFSVLPQLDTFQKLEAIYDRNIGDMTECHFVIFNISI